MQIEMVGTDFYFRRVYTLASDAKQKDLVSRVRVWDAKIFSAAESERGRTAKLVDDRFTIIVVPESEYLEQVRPAQEYIRRRRERAA